LTVSLPAPTCYRQGKQVRSMNRLIPPL
jgi:hypothetical protein